MSGYKIDFIDRQTGAALVEFAIVLPLLLLLMLGIVEFSFAFFHLNTLNKSVQDAALYFSEWARCSGANNCSPNIAINLNATNPYVLNAQRLVMTGNPSACDDTTNPSLMPLCANYNYTPPAITSPDADHIRVTATYRHSFITGTALNNIAKAMFSCTNCYSSFYDLTASSVMRAQ